MILDVLFVISFVCVINFLLICFSFILGNDLKIPLPFFHLFGSYTFANTYVATSAMLYQAMYWAKFYSLIG